MPVNVLSSTSRVESPFILVEIGGYAFGAYNKDIKSVIDSEGFTRKYVVTYPNYVTRLTVNKVGGSLNTYNISLVYAIQAGDDPNRVDKIISRVSNTRRLTVSYGDYNTPNYIYKDEQALITQITHQIDVDNARINYSITAVSGATCLQAGVFSFGEKEAKPSDIIKELINEASSGILDVFPGMRSAQLIGSQELIDKHILVNKNEKIIADDDQTVTIQAKSNVSIFDYIKYLVSCMSCITDDPNSITNKHKYALTIQDDTTGLFGGPYFKVTKMATNIKEINSLDMFEVDIGYPSHNIVTNFSIRDDQTYALLYDYAQNVQQSQYTYRVNDKGEFDYIYNPALSKSRDLYISTEADKNWWSRVTQYPISANITLKGLLRPAMLMTYLKVNVWFYGQKHNSSGVYIITSQVDEVSSQGYRTTLGLTRIAGDTII